MDNEQDSKVKEAVPDYNRHYTYADYLTWDDDQRWELIDGVPYLMAAPTFQHQGISGNLHLIFGNFLKGKSCKVYYAPFDVRLNADTKDDTVVQPDLVIICDQSIMMKTGCIAAPDMAIEILSPSSAKMDRLRKFKKYQQAGIKEYWIVDPEDKFVQVNILKDESYVTKVYGTEEIIPVTVLDGFEVSVAEVFDEEETT